MSVRQGTYSRNVDPPSEYHSLMADSRAELYLWIRRNLKPTKVKVYPCTSYGLKHAFEHDAGFTSATAPSRGDARS